MNNGGPAFPVECYFTEHGATGVQTSPSSGMATGLTIRDYFAIRATEVDIDDHRKWRGTANGGMIMDMTREQARYAFADAMLAQRDGGQ